MREQRPQTSRQALQQQQQQETINERNDLVVDGDHEQQQQPRNVYYKVFDIVEKFASTRMGQFVIERGDRALRVIESTARWSLPNDNFGFKLDRPLPWIPFLTLIIALRLTRVWLSIGAILIGNDPISPHDVIYFIQTRRRKLRAIRIHGKKAIQAKAQLGEPKFLDKVKKLVSFAICRPVEHSSVEDEIEEDPSHHIYLQRGRDFFFIKKPTFEKAKGGKRPRSDSSTDQNCTFEELIAKYAVDSSDDDPDFVPNEADANTDDASFSSNNYSNYYDKFDAEKNDVDSATEGISGTETETATESGTGTETAVSNTDSPDIRQNGDKLFKNPIPMPIALKKEPISDADSVAKPVETPVVDVVPNNKSKLNVSSPPNGDKNKSTPGHLSAAMEKPFPVNVFNNVPNAGSPPNFNACISPPSIVKQLATGEVDAQSTPTSVAMKTMEGSSASNVNVTAQSSNKKPATNQEQQQNQQNSFRSNRNQSNRNQHKSWSKPTK